MNKEEFEVVDVSQARMFAEEVRRTQRVPQDTKTWREFRVKNVLYTWNPMGYYQSSSFDFEDDSTWTRGKVYD